MEMEKVQKVKKPKRTSPRIGTLKTGSKKIKKAQKEEVASEEEEEDDEEEVSSEEEEEESSSSSDDDEEEDEEDQKELQKKASRSKSRYDYQSICLLNDLVNC
ncbi:hypothetical protein RHMOL_Rhmol10G0187300 [Rhododendron molle]|uniref:Uncharacterized protein n=1 Tax=Rhododendron molle TaxID=49168 RepID=A0ACC0M3H2_RHOML|nr:hypothetical protein RHMOL_Rhmol10G0187300 [Rhododendron molle]